MEKMLVQINGVTKIHELLPAINDEHGGVTVKVETPMEPNVFHYMLKHSITEWKMQVLITQKLFVD